MHIQYFQLKKQDLNKAKFLQRIWKWKYLGMNDIIGTYWLLADNCKKGNHRYQQMCFFRSCSWLFILVLAITAIGYKTSKWLNRTVLIQLITKSPLL